MAAGQPPSCGQQFRKFCETTSVRGVPRIFKSTDKVLIVLWVLTVAACSGLLIWQLTVLFIRYSKFEYTTQFQEGKDRPIFPEVTICNTYAIGTVDTTAALPFEEYFELMTLKRNLWTSEKFKSQYPQYAKIISEDLYSELFDVWASTYGYFASLPSVDNGARISGQKLVINCYAYDWSWTYNTSCEDFVKLRWDPTYYKCNTISIPKQQYPRAVTTIIYLNDFDSISVLTDGGGSPTQSISSGIRVAVHQSGEMPDMRRAIAVGPGTEATIRVSATNRQRLSAPWANCTNKQYLGDSADKELYTYDACFDVCMQNQIIEECGCIAGQMIFTKAQFRLANYSICGNQTSDDGKFQNNSAEGLIDIVCALVTPDPQLCNAECQFPCSEYQFGTTVTTSSPWPGVAYQLSFYHAYINGRIDLGNVNEFDSTYGKISSNVASGNISLKQSYSLMRELDLITSNFIQLNVVYEDLVSETVTDKASLSPESMLSAVGGTLNLWLGMTIVFAVELIELVYLLIASNRRCSTQSK